MRAALALTLVAAALSAGGCGDDKPPPSALCSQSETTITRALSRAPGRVVLADGTRLSDCVANADDAAELQNFGVVATRVADGLAERGEAVRLGYLIGAAERGAQHGEGVPLELVHRLAVSARRLPAGHEAELERGRRAGVRTG